MIKYGTVIKQRGGSRMFIITGKHEGLYKVLDTNDGITENHTAQTIRTLHSRGINIFGIRGMGFEYFNSTCVRLLTSPKGTPVYVTLSENMPPRVMIYMGYEQEANGATRFYFFDGTLSKFSPSFIAGKGEFVWDNLDAVEVV